MTVPDAKRSTLGALSQRLNVDENGVLSLDGIRAVLVPSTVFVQLQKTGERFLGRVWIGVLYAVGE